MKQNRHYVRKSRKPPSRTTLGRFRKLKASSTSLARTSSHEVSGSAQARYDQLSRISPWFGFQQSPFQQYRMLQKNHRLLRCVLSSYDRELLAVREPKSKLSHLNPPMERSPITTRWHGTTGANGFLCSDRSHKGNDVGRNNRTDGSVSLSCVSCSRRNAVLSTGTAPHR